MSQHGSAPARPLYDRIDLLRVRNGWTKVQVARVAGIDRGTLENWRKQPRTPMASTVKEVAERLGIPQDEALRLAGILPGEATEPKPAAVDEQDDVFTPDEAELVERIRRDPAKRRRLLDAILAGHGHEPRSTETDEGEEPGHKAS